MPEPREPFDFLETGDTITVTTAPWGDVEPVEYELQYLGTTEAEDFELFEWSHNFTEPDGEIRRLYQRVDDKTIWTKRPNYDELGDRDRKYEPVEKASVHDDG